MLGEFVVVRIRSQGLDSRSDILGYWPIRKFEVLTGRLFPSKIRGWESMHNRSSLPITI
jgi:hypothetical protein